MAQISLIPSAFGQASHLDAVGEVARPVVEVGKDVAVEVDHWLKYSELHASQGCG